MGTIAVRLFGAPEIVRDGAAAAADTRKAVAVLAVLALEGRPVRRDTLAGLLWPEATQEHARGSLRRTLSSLRSLIGPDAVIADREVVRLALASEQVDVVSFLELSDTAPAEAAELYRGPLLEGFSTPDAPPFEDWQRRETERLRIRMDHVLDRLAASSEPIEATRWARQRVTLDPLNEAAARQAMSVFVAAGDRAGAVALYRGLVLRLDDELGVQPLDETVAAYEDVRRGSAVSPAHERRSAVEPALARRPKRLVGRQDVLDAIDGLVPRGGLIVLTGEAGSGRTSVLEAWAHLRDAAVILCHPGENSVVLAPFSVWVHGRRQTNEIQTLDALARALGLDSGAVIVIDDLDLADPESITFLAYVLHRPERFPCTILASACRGRTPTSSVWELLDEGSRNGWATDLRLRRLAPTDMRRLLAVAGIDAPGEIDQIVELAEGLPMLAVEYARARPLDGTIPPVVEQLLTGRLARLSSTARQLVEVLDLIDRPAPDDLLRAIAGRTEDEFTSALDELAAADIVSRGALIQLSQRVIGVLARSRLSAGRRRVLHHRMSEVLPAGEAAEHATLAGDTARAAELHHTAAAAAAAAHANATALHHLRAALACGDVGEGSTHLAIGDLEVLAGRYDAARQAYETSAARALGVDLVRVELRLAQLAIRTGDPALATSHLESAYAEVPPESSAADFEIAVTAGLLEATSGRHRGAVDAAIACAKEIGRLDFEAEAEGVAALAAYRRRHWDQALRSAASARRLALLASTPLTEAAAANIVGLVRSETGDAARAIEAFEQARSILDEHGDRHRLAAVHANLADACHATGRRDEARLHQLESARLFAEVSGPPSDGRAELWFLTAW